MEVLYKIENLTKYYANKKAIDIPKLELKEGGIYTITGPNGAGKTTLLNLLASMEIPTSGRIYFKGSLLNGAKSIRNQITMISHNPYIFRTTVAKNIEYGLRIRAVSKREMTRRVLEVMPQVGLAGYENRKASELSAGEQRRMCLARAIILNPKVLLLDEPTINVDRQNHCLVEEIIKDINNDSTTIIFTTHDLEQALRLSDRIIPLLGGRVVDSHIENLFPANIIKTDGLSWAETDERVRLLVTAEKEGESYISINPEDILVSLEPFKSSARNCLMGEVSALTTENVKEGLIKIIVNVGINLSVLITKKSFDELNLNLGSRVYLTFKVSSIKVFPI